MRGAIMQPTYLPWLGYFAMIDDVDVFVFLDNVQLTKRSWQVRNRIKERDGKELMLTIPVKSEGRDMTKICDAVFANEEWINKHLMSIRQSYRKSKYYDEIMPLVEKVYGSKYDKLSDFTIDFITCVCKYVGIDTTLLRSSQMEGVGGTKDDLLVSICKSIGVDCYLSAKGSSIYIESEHKGGAFSDANILLEYQNYVHPEYDQLGKEFMPYMGVIDVLFNEGKSSLNIIKSGVRTSFTSENVFDD